LDISGCAFKEGVLDKLILDSGANLTNFWARRTNCSLNDSIAILSQYCRKMKILNLSDNITITKDGLLQVVIKCKRLRRVYVNGCKLKEDSINQIQSANPYVVITHKAIQ